MLALYAKDQTSAKLITKVNKISFDHLIDKLDIFAKLNGDIKEGLPAEIKLRKMQYEYYREKLLCFPERSQM